MESDQPPTETSDDPKSPTTPEEQQHQTTTTTTTTTTTHSTPPRSYECNFCKRGFTNAQALGGHMNIHRKDKNKFKHSSSSSTTSTPNAAVESPSSTRPRLSPTTTTNPFSISHQGNWFSTPSQQDLPLPLFGHTEVTRNINQPENYPASPDRGVDLELRLGHVEPPPSETTPENKTSTTRKFF